MQCRAPHYTTRVMLAVSTGNVNATGCRTQTVMNQRLKLVTRTPHPWCCTSPLLWTKLHVHRLLILRPHLLLSSSIYFHNTACWSGEPHNILHSTSKTWLLHVSINTFTVYMYMYTITVHIYTSPIILCTCTCTHTHCTLYSRWLKQSTSPCTPLRAANTDSIITKA